MDVFAQSGGKNHILKTYLILGNISYSPRGYRLTVETKLLIVYNLSSINDSYFF